MNNIDDITTIVSFVIFMILIFFFAITLAVRYRKRKREHEELVLKLAAERLKIQIEIQEETLQHISRELHDNLGHIASLIKINLNTIKLQEKQAEEKIESTKELTRQLIGDLKRLSVRLSDNPITQLGFMGAVMEEVKRLNNTGLFTATFTTAGEMPDIEKEKAIILYRMVQEVLTNIIKHSQAKNITIKLEYINKSIILVLSDNGLGFDMTEQKNAAGAGLRNLNNRARLLNASVDIESRKGYGTTVTIKMLY